MTTNNAIAIEFDEDRGGPRTADNRISCPQEGDFYRLTRHLGMEWQPCGAHDNGRSTTPSIYIESLFARAPVNRAPEMGTETVLTKCLDVQLYLEPALQLLIEEGLLKGEDDNGDEIDAAFDTYDDLQRCANALVESLKDNPIMEVTAAKLEWLEGHDIQVAEAKEYDWFAKITIDAITAMTYNMEHYVKVKRVVGPHATVAERTRNDSVFNAMVGGYAGGQLAQAIKAYAYPTSQGAQHVEPSFLAGRLSDFLHNSKWPKPYDYTPGHIREDSYDIVRMAAWPTATRQEWATLVQPKLEHALFGKHSELPTLADLFLDYKGDTARLCREVQRIGDLMLPNDEGTKLPFWKIEEVEVNLKQGYGPFISSERQEGRRTLEILERLSTRVRADRANSKVGDKALSDEDLRGPKPGQMARAMAEHSFTNIEGKFTDVLQRGDASTVSKLQMLAEVLTADTVLPKAVLFACKGTRLSVYLGSSDFLALLHGERHLMRHYLAQTLAFDESLGAVPEHMKTLLYDEQETRRTCDFKWGELDPLNQCVLWLRGERVGTQFAKHSVNNLYTDGDMLDHIIDLYGKKFNGLGFPKSVPKTEGYTFPGYFGLIKRFQVYAVAMSKEERPQAFTMIADFARQGFVAAAAAAYRRTYGATPADRAYGAWISAEEPVVIELVKALESLEEVATWRRRMGPMVGSQVKAAMLPGYATTSGAGGGGAGPPPQPGKGGKAKQGAPSQKTAIKATTGGDSTGGKAPRESGRGKRTTYAYEDGSFSIGKLQPATLRRPHALSCPAQRALSNRDGGGSGRRTN